MPAGWGSDYDSPNIKLTIWLVRDTFFLFLDPSGPTGGLLMLQCFSTVADAKGISRCLNALLLSSPQSCFATVISLYFYIVRVFAILSH